MEVNKTQPLHKTLAAFVLDQSFDSSLKRTRKSNKFQTRVDLNIGQVLTPAQMGSETCVTSDNTSNVDAASVVGLERDQN